MKRLEDVTPQEMADEATRLHRLYGAEGGTREYLTWIGGLRQECFERRVRQMDPEGKLEQWEADMTAKYQTPRVMIFAHEYTWLAALGVARYGEAPDHWPDRFTDEDVVRAKRWLYNGNAPEGTTYLPPATATA